jgi:NTE family protein
VSNAGKPFEARATLSRNWASIGSRCFDVIDNQVLSLRKRLLLQALTSGERHGAFWDIQQDVVVHRCDHRLPCPHPRTLELSQVPTDLAAKDDELQERLINWGYAVTDAAVRTWFNRRLPSPAGFPYPDVGV